MTQRVTFAGEAKQGSPLEAVPWDPEDKAALTAIKECRATPEQQKLFMVWFLKATGVDEMEFRLDARLSAVASGKRWIAHQFFSIVNSVIKEVKPDGQKRTQP